MVGGGPEGKNPKSSSCATVIEGEVKEGLLTVRVHNVVKGEIADTQTFKPRKGKRARKG